MTSLTQGVSTMLVLIMLQSLVLIAEGGTLQHLPEDNVRSLPLNHENVMKNNDIGNDHPNPKFFQNMVNTNHELTAVESHQKTSKFQPDISRSPPSGNPPSESPPSGNPPSESPPSGSFEDTEDPQSDTSAAAEEASITSSSSAEKKTFLDNQQPQVATPVTTPETPKGKVLLIVVPNWKRPWKQSHHRQKRFITASRLRIIAVPLSVFNFLGFLPVRVPGLPYHNDLPPPDYTYYNTMHDIPTPKRYRYF